MRADVHPDATIPASLGFGVDDLKNHTGRRLDDHFAAKAGALHHHYLELIRVSQERGLNLLAWEYAKVAAHWLRVARDFEVGQLVEVTEGVTLC